MKTITLTDLLYFLDQQTAGDFKGDKVDRFLQQHAIAPVGFEAYTHFKKETYGRNLVSKNDRYELLLLTWLPNQCTPIHDHAQQRCWMILQRGTLLFRNYDFRSLETNSPIPMGPTEIHAAGAAVYIDDGMGLHSIANTSSGMAMSLHLYAKPIETCKVYDEKARQFVSKELSYTSVPATFFSQDSKISATL